MKCAKDWPRPFTRKCLIERSKSIDNVIHHNKSCSEMQPKKVSKGKQQLTSLKSDVRLFSRLYIGCQTRDGNQACPPALSDNNNLYLGTKSDLLIVLYLEDLSEVQSEAPVTSSVILNGALIIQMLKPAYAKSFAEYASQIFIPYILSQLQNASCLD